jgi:cysteine synthase
MVMAAIAVVAVAEVHAVHHVEAVAGDVVEEINIVHSLKLQIALILFKTKVSEGDIHTDITIAEICSSLFFIYMKPVV